MQILTAYQENGEIYRPEVMRDVAGIAKSRKSCIPHKPPKSHCRTHPNYNFRYKQVKKSHVSPMQTDDEIVPDSVDSDLSAKIPDGEKIDEESVDIDTFSRSPPDSENVDQAPVNDSIQIHG
ncbi:uncharacterized protein LOC117125460 [Anneissia japonica]|uniref:uncharacterized protein LOC117125460 n=1 Tax=Anneissia japonica TaxID=1529436 RepID=UPI0014256AC1|nr:uncharacterized protein LOC117125460 [Anneissia japonica]